MKNGLDLGNSQKYTLQKLVLLINTEATSNPATDFFKPTLKINARNCVGRNKAFQAQARISVSGIRTRTPETPTSARLGWSYSDLRLKQAPPDKHQNYFSSCLHGELFYKLLLLNAYSQCQTLHQFARGCLHSAAKRNHSVFMTQHRK